MGIQNHLTYLLRNLHAGQELTVRSGHGMKDWFKICKKKKKKVHQGCIFSPCLFNLYVGLFSHQVMSYSLWSHGLQHARLPCPSPSPGVCPSSSPLHPWCHPIISSVAIFSFCLQSFPGSVSFPMNWLFASAGQNIGASVSVFPMNI